MYSVLALNFSLTSFQNKRKRRAPERKVDATSELGTMVAIVRKKRSLLDLEIKHNKDKGRAEAELRALRDQQKKDENKARTVTLQRERAQAQQEIQELQKELGQEIIASRHDYHDAVEMSSTIDPGSDREYIEISDDDPSDAQGVQAGDDDN